MKKKRILSLLLAATLISSSLLLTAAAADYELQSTDVISLDDTEWVTSEGTNAVAVDAARDGDTDAYLHIGNVDSSSDGITYTFEDGFTFEPGVFYKVSFYARTMATKDATAAMELRVLYTNAETGNGVGVNSIGCANAGNIPNRATLTDEWQEYWHIIWVNPETYENGYSINALTLRRHWNAKDAVPYEIDGVSIVEAVPLSSDDWSEFTVVENPVNYMADCTYAPCGNAVITEVTDTEYLTVDAASTNTSVTYTGMETLTPGVYEVSGKFRLPVVDFGKLTYVKNEETGADTGDVETNDNYAALTASFADEALDGSVTVTNDWTDATFAFELTKRTSLSGLAFALDDTVALDFDNITVTKISGLDYSEDYITNGYEGAVVNVNDARPGDTDAQYMRLSGLEKYASGIKFPAVDSEFTLDTEKNYKLSLWIRTMPNTGNDPGEENTNVSMLYFKVGATNPKALFGWAGYNSNFNATATITDEWAEYTAIFKPTSAVPTDVQIYRYVNAASVVPFDIDGISFIEVEQNEAGEWVTVDGAEELIDADAYIANPGHTAPTFTTVTDLEYTRVKSVTGVNTAFNAYSDEVLTPGIYEISGKFRLGEFDYTKLTYNATTAYNVDSDNNTAKLTAECGSDALEGSIALTNDWTVGTFTLDAASAVNVSDIVYTLDDDAALDFDDITITKVATYTDKYVSADNTPVLVTNDERTGDTDSSYGSFVGAENTGVIYTQTESMPAGTYTVSFWARSGERLNAPTSNPEGATSVYQDGLISIRPLLNGVEYKPSGARGMKITDEWTYYSFDVTTTADSDNLKLELRRHWFTEDGGAPVYVDDISVVAYGSTANLYDSTGNWTANGAAEYIAIDADTEIYRIGAGEANTAFTSASEDVLSAGVYEISGKYRVVEYDYNNADGTLLTASVGDNVIGDAVTVTNAWTEGTFVLETTKAVAVSDIVFAIDGTYTLDFTDITVTQTVAYSDEYANADGSPVIPVTDVREGDTDNSYIHVHDRTHQQAAAIYQADELTFDSAKTYKLSFFARSTASDITPGFRVIAGAMFTSASYG